MGRPLELHRCAWRLGLWDCADIEDDQMLVSEDGNDDNDDDDDTFIA